MLIAGNHHLLADACIEYISQDFIRCDSTANNFSKEKETFTYMLVV